MERFHPERPTPRFMAGLFALIVGLGSAARFGAREYVFPDFAPSLVPALFGVMFGILVAQNRQAASGQTRKVYRRKSPPLNGRVVAGLLVAAAFVALLEQQLAQHVYPQAPLWMRVAVLVLPITFGVSELGSLIVVGSASPAAEGQPESRERP
jgi:hypothetical protein